VSQQLSREPELREVVVSLARELYDRFVMGGWAPQDAYGIIERFAAHELAALREEVADANREADNAEDELAAARTQLEQFRMALFNLLTMTKTKTFTHHYDKCSCAICVAESVLGTEREPGA